MFCRSLPIVLLFFCGCTHIQLRRNTAHQSGSLADIYEQQVLDNLARFVRNPGALPSFAYPNQGASNVSDSASGGSTLGFSRTGFASAGITGGASRGMTEAWTLTPVYDPRRLELMRCAYQTVILNAGMSSTDCGCPDCDILLRKFYTGTANGESLAEFSARTGRTTPACFAASRWFAYGTKPPKHKYGCCKIGESCGTYVWLLPCGQEELAKLTLTILDFANSLAALPPPVESPPAPATQEVTLYLTDDDQPTTAIKATKVVRRQELLDSASPTSALVTPESTMQNTLESLPAFSPEPPPSAPNNNIFSPLGLEMNRFFLTPSR